MIAASACAAVPAGSVREPSPGVPSDETPAPVLVVAASPPVQSGKVAIEEPTPAPPSPPLDLLAGVQVPKFPADNLNTAIGVGCGGGCPPAYVLETNHRDDGQIEARVRFCEKLARKHLPNMRGSVSVRAQIDVAGRARRVVIDKDGDLPPALTACVQRLVETATFSSKYNYEREAVRTDELKAVDEPEEK